MPGATHARPGAPAQQPADDSASISKRPPNGGHGGAGDLEARESAHRPVAGLVLVAAFAAVLVAALVGIPREHSPLPAIARHALLVALPRWKITEPVNEVVYGTRGFDTSGRPSSCLPLLSESPRSRRAREARRGFIGEEVAGQREQAQVDPAPPVDTGEEKARRAEEEEQGEQGGWRRKLPD